MRPEPEVRILRLPTSNHKITPSPMTRNATSSNPSMAAMNAFYPMVVITGFIQLLVPSTIHMIMNHFHVEAGKAAILPLIFFTGIRCLKKVLTYHLTIVKSIIK